MTEHALERRITRSARRPEHVNLDRSRIVDRLDPKMVTLLTVLGFGFLAIALVLSTMASMSLWAISGTTSLSLTGHMHISLTGVRCGRFMAKIVFSSRISSLCF